jgi:hypothetical protein
LQWRWSSPKGRLWDTTAKGRCCSCTPCCRCLTKHKGCAAGVGIAKRRWSSKAAKAGSWAGCGACSGRCTKQATPPKWGHRWWSLLAKRKATPSHPCTCWCCRGCRCPKQVGRGCWCSCTKGWCGCCLRSGCSSKPKPRCGAKRLAGSWLSGCSKGRGRGCKWVGSRRMALPRLLLLLLLLLLASKG